MGGLDLPWTDSFEERRNVNFGRSGFGGSALGNCGLYCDHEFLCKFRMFPLDLEFDV